MYYWRNGKVSNKVNFSTIFTYIWVMPLPWLYLFFGIFSHHHASGMPLDEALKDIQKNNDVGKELFWTSNILLIIGIGAWLITAVIRLTPAFSLTPTTLSISGFGLADHFSLTMIKKISVYPLGPLGTLVDVKAPVGFNTRKLLFITQVDKKSLREYLASTQIEIN